MVVDCYRDVRDRMNRPTGSRLRRWLSRQLRRLNNVVRRWMDEGKQ